VQETSDFNERKCQNLIRTYFQFMQVRKEQLNWLNSSIHWLQIGCLMQGRRLQNGLQLFKVTIKSNEVFFCARHNLSLLSDHSKQTTTIQWFNQFPTDKLRSPPYIFYCLKKAASPIYTSQYGRKD